MQLQLASSDWGVDLGGLDDRSCEATRGIPGGGAVLTSLPFINIFSVLSAHTYFQSLQQPFECKKTKHQGGDRPGSGSYSGKLPDQDLNLHLSICL